MIGYLVAVFVVGLVAGLLAGALVYGRKRAEAAELADQLAAARAMLDAAHLEETRARDRADFYFAAFVDHSAERAR